MVQDCSDTNTSRAGTSKNANVVDQVSITGSSIKGYQTASKAFRQILSLAVSREAITGINVPRDASRVVLLSAPRLTSTRALEKKKEEVAAVDGIDNGFQKTNKPKQNQNRKQKKTRKHSKGSSGLTSWTKRRRQNGV